MNVLELFHPVVREWFSETYGEPTPPQAEGWPAIAAGRNVLILAPTGSGKTLAAFLHCLDWLYRRAVTVEPAGSGEAVVGRGDSGVTDGVRVLYISPLKALNNDIYRNLEVPSAGIQRVAARKGLSLPELRVGVRTGDTPSRERRAMLKKPPQILITTPESLFLLLSSSSRRILQTVRFVIVDEIHALLPTKRGAHLSLCLEYLEELAGRPIQRIGLSATLRPLEEAAAFLGGQGRDVKVIDTGQRKNLDLRVELPVRELRDLPEKTIWPEIYRYLLNRVESHRSTLIFVNNRHVAERVTANLNDLAGTEIARVHHGSVSREVRQQVEELLKTGRLKCLVATSSLELGIDVGSIDLVIQVESPHEVARALQRVGRAGHVVGLASKGRIVPKTRADLLEAAVIAREMAGARIETMRAPRNCLDVLAQVIVGMTAEREWPVEDLFSVIRRAHGYRGLAWGEFTRVLAMLSGQIVDEEEFLEMRPRLFWDRVNGRVRASDAGKRLVYTSGGTIPDRGTYGVYLAGSPVRLGELDEEFVFERRAGDRFMLGTSCWRVEEIRQDRVIVTPATGASMLPFWRGEGFGRPYGLGLRMGAFLREAEQRMDKPAFCDWLQKQCLLDASAAENLASYLRDQREATGVLPTDRRVIIEEFRDELGEWRIMVHSVYGQRVNAPLAMLLEDRLRREHGLEVESVRLDDGIMFHCPGAAEPPDLDLGGIAANDVEETVAALVGTTTIFGVLFRENAARALMLPRGAYGRKRTPLWLSRLKAADLLQVVQKHESFPVVTETYREILADIYALRGLAEVLRGIMTGAISVVHSRRRFGSPFAQTALFEFLASYVYEPDLPKAERRLHASGLDRQALRRLVGRAELGRLLDPTELEMAVEEARHEKALASARTPDEVHALLLRLGELDDEDAIRLGCRGLLDDLAARRRAACLSWNSADGGRVSAWVAAENCHDYVVAFGIHGAGLGLDDLVTVVGRTKTRSEAVEAVIRRYAASHGPFGADEVRCRYGFTQDEVLAALRCLEAEGKVQSGEFRADGAGEQWCDAALLQRAHRRSLAKARRAIEPRSPEEFVLFLAQWQGVVEPGQGVEGLNRAINQLGGVFLPAAVWEAGVLPARVRDYSRPLLDQLIGSGLCRWQGRGGLEALEVAFWPSGEKVPAIRGREEETPPSGPARKLLAILQERGALFLSELWQSTDLSPQQTLDALEELAAGGLVTNDTFGPVRQLLNGVTSGWGKPRAVSALAAALSGMGRWSRLRDGTEEERSGEALASALLGRYGILSREVAAAEGVPWSAISPVLAEWEVLGKIQRGYFVRGLSGIQYATAAAVERLRTGPETGLPEMWGLLARDPALAWGRLLEWPGNAPNVPRGHAAVVILRRGIPIMVGEGRPMRVSSVDGLEEEVLSRAFRELWKVVRWSVEPGRKVEVQEFNGKPVLVSPAVEPLASLGFERGYKSMVKWP